MEPMLLLVEPAEPQCSSTLLPQEAPEALGDQAFGFGLFKRSEAAPHLNSGAAVPLPQLCCSRPSSHPWPLLAAAPLLAGACTRLPDTRLAETPRSSRCLMARPRATMVLQGTSLAAAGIQALPLLCSMPLTVGASCSPASMVTRALLLLCSGPPLPGSGQPAASVVTKALLLLCSRLLLLSRFSPTASMVTAALLLPCCRLSAVPVLSVGSGGGPMLLLLLPPAQRSGLACLRRAHRA